MKAGRPTPMLAELKEANMLQDYRTKLERMRGLWRLQQAAEKRDVAYLNWLTWQSVIERCVKENGR